MITYIELWKAKQSWIDLSREERVNYSTALGPAIQQMLDNDVQIVSWGASDPSTFNKIDYDFLLCGHSPT